MISGELNKGALPTGGSIMKTDKNKSAIGKVSDVSRRKVIKTAGIGENE